MLDNLRGMAVFASVVQQGSFGGAAKELGITTSAVSQQIRALEADLGVALLHRSTRKLSLSEAGETLYWAAVQMVKAAEQGKSNISQLKGEVLGNLRIGTSSIIAQKYLLPALSDWIDEHENLTVNMVCKGDKLDIIHDRVDIAVILTQDEQGINAMQVRQLLLASPEYLARHAPICQPSDLMTHPIISASDKTLENIEFVNYPDKIAMKINAKVSTNSTQTTVDLACHGHGIIKADEMQVEGHLATGQLVPVLDEYPLPKLYLSIITPSKDQKPVKVQKCLSVLKAYFEALSS